MKKWADFLVSEVTYDQNHKISIIKRHTDTESGITPGIEIGRLDLSSDIYDEISYVTIYKSGSIWKLGNKIPAKLKPLKGKMKHILRDSRIKSNEQKMNGLNL